MDDDAIDRLVAESMREIQSKIDSLSEQNQFHNSIALWREERDKMRSIFNQFCLSPSKSLFLAWWRTSIEDIRRALVLASIEELEEIPEYSNLSDSLCVEIKDTESLIRVTGDSDKFTTLFNHLANSRENDRGVFQGQDDMIKIYGASLKDPQIAIECLLVMRSYLLLNFVVNIILVFETEANEYVEVETINNNTTKCHNNNIKLLSAFIYLCLPSSIPALININIILIVNIIIFGCKVYKSNRVYMF
ncbi:hypothetical protein PPL_04230 [Heterostelium album PN500]|uniref:Uncharacterized protein n=1 Tax=Heterostelium pallidum (strain ATCC 26659 / Pp 5 / PN500) TaxID=670386 RepID=D3B6Z9_HETP5|nr:hypothetical protein PPL_04230 [Heterostelium album PN500]EFA82542.1 hypothetical protein PPL_04230 [Heterostelium album PN500]|eukprot:XP_020434659.1 hypothetical protein PPL_04230 [Heterostelium album PN500]